MNIDVITDEINSTLKGQVEQLCSEISEIDESLSSVTSALTDYLTSGKRFRPLFAILGFLGTGSKLSPEIFRAVCALEFLQASALIHDDLMDGSDTRRGKPAIHKQFGKIHGEDFGSAAAILIGDLALIWSEQSLQESGIGFQQLQSVNSIFAKMRSELMAGQFLDIFEQTQNGFSIERSLKIARYKSGKYSIERPLHFGAALSGSKNLETFHQIYSDYGLPLGEAFQLRDDLLGVFGDPAVTGKPAGDDLCEGKKTALIAFAYDRGSEPIKKLISQKLGTSLSEQEVDQLRGAIIESGAVIHVEDLIEKLAENALDAINQAGQSVIEETTRGLLAQMVDLVTKRTS